MHLITTHLSNGFGNEQNYFLESREALLGCRGLWDFSTSYHPLPPGISTDRIWGCCVLLPVGTHLCVYRDVVLQD